jgi:hypothetical protein
MITRNLILVSVSEKSAAALLKVVMLNTEMEAISFVVKYGDHILDYIIT